MNERGDDIEWIDRYLNGLLAADEKKLFEQKMQSDTAFHQQVKVIAELREGIREAGRKELLKEMKAWDQASPPLPVATAVWWHAWPVKIAALLVVSLSVFFLWPKENTRPDLFARYFEPYPNVVMPTVRGDEDADSTVIQKAYRAYDQGNYAEAIRLFESVGAGDESVALYLANSYLAGGETGKAIPILEKLESGSKLFEEEARWYLTLAYLEAGNNEQAVRLLNGPWPERYRERVREISGLAGEE